MRLSQLLVVPASLGVPRLVDTRPHPHVTFFPLYIPCPKLPLFISTPAVLNQAPPPPRFPTEGRGEQTRHIAVTTAGRSGQDEASAIKGSIVSGN